MKHSRFQLHHSHKAKKQKALGQVQLRFFLLPPLPPSLEAAVKFFFFHHVGTDTLSQILERA